MHDDGESTDGLTDSLVIPSHGNGPSAGVGGNALHAPRSPSLARVRHHRQRRRDGLRCVLLDVRDGEVKALIARGYLAKAAANDVDAIGRALGLLLDKAL